MLIPQIPGDWAGLVPPINKIWEDLVNTRQQLGILTNYVDLLEKRVVSLEGTRAKSRNAKMARKTLSKKEHWVTKAKKDLDTIKESRKRQNLHVKTKVHGIPLYKLVTQYVKTKDVEVLKEIFG